MIAAGFHPFGNMYIDVAAAGAVILPPIETIRSLPA
jgi:hypothetical protein